MRILILSPYEVYPPNFGGQVRIYNLAKQLVELGNNVTIACNYTGFKKRKDFLVGKVKIKFFKTYIQDVVALFNKIGFVPLIISYPFHKIIRRVFKNLLLGYDIVQFEQPFLACWMDMTPQKTLKVYSAQNVEQDFDLIGFGKSAVYNFYKKILVDCENNALHNSDVVIAVSEEDKNKLALVYNIGRDKIFVVENGFDSGRDKTTAPNLKTEMCIDKSKKIATFVGSSTLPNLKAVEFITQKIAPKNLGIIFLLVGDSANCYRGHNSNVIKVGKVEELDKYLTISDIGLLPVEEGSGSNLKLLSYLKFNLQVISTNFGMRGYKDLIKYVNIVPLSKFPSRISNVIKKHIPRNTLKKYEWKNLALKLSKVYTGTTRSN